MNKRNNNLLIIILFILSINDIQSNTDFNGIIRNATKISPLIWQHRNEVLIKNKQKIIDYLQTITKVLICFHLLNLYLKN